MFNNDDILAALAKVPGPDGKTPLPQTGAVSGISIREGKVFLSIAVTPEQAPHCQPMRQAAEDAVKAVSGVKGAVVVLTSERAPDSAPQGRAQGRQWPRPCAAWRDPWPGSRRHQEDRRGRLRQGRRRQVHDLRQSRDRPRPARPQGRAARRRPVRPVAAAPVRHFRPSRHGAGRRAEADREIRRQGDVDRLSGARRRGDRLARPDGDVGPDPVAARRGLGRARRAGGRHAARHRRHPAHHGAECRRSPAR